MVYLILSLLKREYPKGEGVIKSHNIKVLSKLLHRRAVLSELLRHYVPPPLKEEEFILYLLLLIRRSWFVAKPQD